MLVIKDVENDIGNFLEVVNVTILVEIVENYEHVVQLVKVSNLNEIIGFFKVFG